MHNLQPNFTQKCLRIQQDDKLLTRLSTPWFAGPDFYMLLGQSLTNNTHLDKLHLRNLVLNEVAAQALANGIAQSKLKHLECEGSIIFQEHDEQEQEQQDDIQQHVTSRQQQPNRITTRRIDNNNNNHESSAKIKEIRPILFRGIKSSSTIESIRFTRFPMEQRNYDLANALSILQSLQSLSICGFHNNNATSTQQHRHHHHHHRSDHYRNHHNRHQGSSSVIVGCSSSYPYAQLISEVLIRSSTLVRLELCDGELGDTAAPHFHGGCGGGGTPADAMYLLAQGLQQNMSLTTLELNRCHIGDMGVELLVQHWHPQSKLHSLNLFRNAIGPNGAQCLLRAIADRPSMKRLDLSENKQIGYRGLQLIGEILLYGHQHQQNQRQQYRQQQHQPDQQRNQLRLTSLHLLGCATWRNYDGDNSNNNDDDPSCCQEALAQEKARHDAGQALLEGIQHNFYLHELTLFRNSFPVHIKNEIGFYACVNRKGRFLLSSPPSSNDDLNHDLSLSPTIWCWILAKCQRHKIYDHSLMYYFLREQPNLMMMQPPQQQQQQLQPHPSTIFTLDRC